MWCLGSVLMRITDLGVAVSVNFLLSRYGTMTLAAFGFDHHGLRDLASRQPSQHLALREA
ncbi:hypothetical protein A8144_12655 [Mycobacterium leprae 3125609]|uniref:hypothetical protein n=1 Tax=Mycobacterium leprae TaxID=1769 RepID=UPI0007DB7F8A|nr:hypothetical protein [Mycobacterium leprae]OAR20046.1 hypothetical protein A8144_12655 [Mycobacterium leprae 3125609]